MQVRESVRRVYLERCTELSFVQPSSYSAINLIGDRRYLYLGYVTHSTLLTPVALRAAGSNDALLRPVRLAFSLSLSEIGGEDLPRRLKHYLSRSFDSLFAFPFARLATCGSTLS